MRWLLCWLGLHSDDGIIFDDGKGGAHARCKHCHKEYRLT
jgi:hypothetical protein